MAVKFLGKTPHFHYVFMLVFSVIFFQLRRHCSHKYKAANNRQLYSSKGVDRRDFVCCFWFQKCCAGSWGKHKRSCSCSMIWHLQFSEFLLTELCLEGCDWGALLLTICSLHLSHLKDALESHSCAFPHAWTYPVFWRVFPCWFISKIDIVVEWSYRSNGKPFSVLALLRKYWVQICLESISQPWQKAAFFTLFPTAQRTVSGRTSW